MKKLNYYPIFFLFLVLFSACSENESKKDDETEKITLELEFFVKDKPLKLLQEYQNDLHQKYLLENFKFYLSNFEFESASTNETFKVEDSYLLFSADREATTFEREILVKKGDFSKMNFSIGVDSIKNTSLDNTGDLDISNSMAWDWNTGYKFVVMEGKYFNDVSNPNASIPLVFHIGLNSNYKKVSLSFDSVNDKGIFSTENKKIVLRVDLNDFFSSPNQIDFNEINNIMGGGKSALLSQNYENGFVTLKEIQ
ncbi:MbnP family protein [Bernardetia sp. Wsw4-3y2]|uniref:MbnP family protein n=1 Tax=Bernardetia sp. Wsw4-3y2 TaxID=3127471 RepID=UPI0030D0C28A